MKAFADILLEVFENKSVYRYGGDEFLIVYRGSDLAAFEEKLDKVNERFSTVKLDTVTLKLGCSFGSLAVKPSDPFDFFDHLTEADHKLYEEKERINAKR